MAIKCHRKRGDVGTSSLNIESARGVSGGGRKLLVLVLKQKSLPRQGSNARPLLPASPQPENHMFDPSKNFSLEMMRSRQNRGAWNKGSGGVGGEPLTSSAWERRDLGHSSPPKMPLGFKGSREAGHPQRPVSGKQVHW